MALKSKALSAFSLILICLFAQSFNISASGFLDSLVQDYAFRTLIHHLPHTGALYNAALPKSLSGMNVSVVRLRSRRLWNRGANFSYFSIPPKTMPVPHVRRLAIVYQNLGNWSSHYFAVPAGYSLITSVIGFMVMDASNVHENGTLRNLSLNTMGQLISIKFPDMSKLMNPSISQARCLVFDSNGTAGYLTDMSSLGLCYAKDQGHFSAVVPTPVLEKEQRLWYVWIVAFVIGFSVLVIMSYAAIKSVKVLKAKKIQVMERQVDDDMVLESRWVGCSKLPAAAVTRTQPAIECVVP